MSNLMALKIAIDLMHVPSRVRFIRAEPLPDDVVLLLRIAARDEEAECFAAALMDRPRTVVREAATFYIEQILFAPGSDSYRVLGAQPQADLAELRRNLALLMKWLHPDTDPRSQRSVFVGKVTAAWNDLKTPQRRAAYDKLRRYDRKTSARSELNVSASGHRMGPSYSNTSRRQFRVRTRKGKRPSLRTMSLGAFLRRALSILLDRSSQ